MTNDPLYSQTVEELLETASSDGLIDGYEKLGVDAFIVEAGGYRTPMSRERARRSMRRLFSAVSRDGHKPTNP